MNNKIFIDSSVLLEYRKGKNTEFFKTLLADEECSLFINQTVVSEYLFHHLTIFGGKAPLTIKVNTNIQQVLQHSHPGAFLSLMKWLSDDASIPQSAIAYMATYNLLPNDALIIATCKLHNIPALASFDPDFKTPCQEEGIRLLQTIADFEAYSGSLGY